MYLVISISSQTVVTLLSLLLNDDGNMNDDAEDPSQLHFMRKLMNLAKIAHW